MPTFTPDNLWGQHWSRAERGWRGDASMIQLWPDPQDPTGQRWVCSLDGVERVGRTPYEACQNLLGLPIRCRVGGREQTLYPYQRPGSACQEFGGFATVPLGVCTLSPDGWRLKASERGYPSIEEAWETLRAQRFFWGREWETLGYGWRQKGVTLVRGPNGWRLLNGGLAYPTREACLTAWFGEPMQVFGHAWYPQGNREWCLDYQTSPIYCRDGQWSHVESGDRYSTPEEAVRDMTAHNLQINQMAFMAALKGVLRSRLLPGRLGIPDL